MTSTILNIVLILIFAFFFYYRQSKMDEKFNKVIGKMQETIDKLMDENTRLKRFIKQLFYDNRNLKVSDKSMLKYIY